MAEDRSMMISREAEWGCLQGSIVGIEVVHGRIVERCTM